MKTSLIFAFLVLAFSYSSTAYAVTFDFAQIGNAGNAGDVQSQGTFGAVAYDYAISKTEVTNAQYTEFLNAVAAIDTYSLYNIFMGHAQGGITQSGVSGNYSYAVKADAGSYTYANKPVVWVSWYDSIRFTNWLHNGQGDGDTESGAYTLVGGTATPSNSLSITRNADAQYWLPSEDEWYKAAHHDASAGTAGTYFDFAIGTDTAPDNNTPTLDSSNSANYHDRDFTTGDLLYSRTDVGAYGLSGSSYGTYDQNGNVGEWNETLVNSFSRSVRGGSLFDPSYFLAASYRRNDSPGFEFDLIGFRVAAFAVPEPSSLLLLISTVGGMLVWRRQHFGVDIASV